MTVQSIWRRWLGYTPLVSRKGDGTEAEEQQLLDEIEHFSRKPSKIFLLLSLVNITIFLLTTTMLFSIRNSQKQSSEELLNAELRATSSYSPVFDMIDLEPSIKQINGSFYAAGDLTIARQFPNPVADAIWEEDIELIRPIPITREQIIKLGKNPDTVAKLEDSVWGLGDDAYVAALDVYHLLHCVNSLRQIAYSNYYDTKIADEEKDNGLYEIHLNHCVDILYQHISCSNNVNLVTRHWVEGTDYPFPDFSINKHCINFDKLTEWHKASPVDMKKYLEVMKNSPDGAKQEPKQVWRPKEWFQKHPST